MKIYKGPQFKEARVCVIEVPPKIWRPKVESRYKMPEYGCDINEGAWDNPNYGKSVYIPKLKWNDMHRDNIIHFQETDQKELDKYLTVGINSDKTKAHRIVTIIKKYWDCFCKEGAKQTVIGYEFGIDIGNRKPVCCRDHHMNHTKQK